MGSSTKKYLIEANSSEENRAQRKNYKRHPYANKAKAFDESEADWLVTYKKYRGNTFDDVDSDIARHRKASGGKSTFSRDRTRASRDAWDILSKR